MSGCGCRYYGNQWGTFYRMCEEHAKVASLVALSEGITLEQLLERAWEAYLQNHYGEIQDAKERQVERRRRREGRTRDSLVEH